MSHLRTTEKLPLIVGLVLLAAATRLMPHPDNFVPTGAMALFGAATLSRRWLALLLPLAAYYVSDLLLNNLVYSAYFEGFYWGVNLWVYGGVLAMTLLGMGLLRRQQLGWGRIGGAAVGATMVFFLLSNFGVWMGGMLYPKTLAGLMACFTAALPFLAMSLAANVLFSFLLFGIAQAQGLVAPGKFLVKPVGTV